MIPTDILNYRIVRHLGSGGMGSVYLAVNTNIDQQVAIKALRPEIARNPVLRARFKQEAELLCSLDHPGIVKFLNYVEAPEGVFLIMEYVKGITLEDFINKKNGLIVEKKAYPMISEILDAFAYAHSKGIVHRDIKPSNIIIQDDGHVKIMDFGIAQIVSEANAADSKYIMGTPTYMSPEQIYGKSVDARSDIYSIGVLIYNMLTGRAPYDSTMLTAQEIKMKVVNEQMPRMSEYYPYISDKIQDVVDKATQKVPDARYQTCEEMKAAVKKAIAPDPIPRPLLYGGVAVLLVLLIGGFLTWDYFRTKVRYYRDYVEVYGIPEGVGRLSGSDVAHREASYRFEYSRYKLRRVSYVNSKGNLVDHHDSETLDRIVDMTLTYTEGSDKVDSEKFMDRNGKVLYVKDYDSNLKTCTFKFDDELGTEMTLNAKVELFQSMFDNSLNNGKSKISKYILEYDDDGYLVKVEYAGFGNVRVPDAQGIFGKRYVLDDEGRVIEEHYLGKDGKPKATKFGLGIKKFTYDDDGNVAKIQYLTTDGKPSSDGNNCPVVLLTYDEYGNRTSEKYTDIDGQPMLRADAPIAGFIYEYNEDGTCRKMQYLGIDGSLTYANGASGYVNEYDDNGYLASVMYIDAKGNAAYYNDPESGESYSKQVRVNDARGNMTDLKLLDASGKLIETALYAHKTCTYDSLGNLLTEYYIDKQGKVYAPAKYGYAGFELEYDAQGRVKRYTHMDAKKMRMTLPKDSYCYYTQEYDVRGNCIKLSFFDDKDKPAMSRYGYATACYEYDENGNETAHYFLDAKGKPCVAAGFCARVEYGYDDQGNCVTERYKNAAGKLMSVAGVAYYEWEHDARGNITVERQMGVTGKIAPGMYEERYKYNDHEQMTEISYFGAGGKPVLYTNGFHKWKATYNSNNQCVQEEYYGTDGKLTNLKGQNYAVAKYEYDKRGNKTSAVLFTKTGARGTDKSKVHKYFYQYDKVANQICHQITFGVDGKPVAADGIAAEARTEFDKRGNTTRLICYDGYGKKANGLKGWCEIRYTYNDADELTSEACYDVAGKPVNDKGMNCHKTVYSYDAMRNPTGVSYYGVDGKPVSVAGGFSSVKYKYNGQNQRTETTYFGTDGRAVDCANGWHREVYTYKDGAEHTVTLYNKAGRKLATGTKVNGEWKMNVQGMRPQPAVYSWRDVWRELAKRCPAKLDESVVVEKITVGNNSVTLSYVMNGATQENVTVEVLQYIRNFSLSFTGNFKTPSYVDIHVIVYDQNHEYINSI